MKSQLQIQACSAQACLRQVEALAAEIWTEHYTSLIGASQVRYMLKKFQSQEAMLEQIREGHRYFIVSEEQKPIGYFSYKIDADALFLSKYYILRGQRGQGYGRTCLDFLEHQCLSTGKHIIRLTVNKGNADTIDRYRHMGFEIVNDIVMDIGQGFVMDDHILEKKLRS